MGWKLWGLVVTVNWVWFLINGVRITGTEISVDAELGPLNNTRIDMSVTLRTCFNLGKIYRKMDTTTTNVTQPDLYTRFLSGFVKVPLFLLNFEPRQNQARELDSRVVLQLEDAFSINFEPATPENHIHGVLTESELTNILCELNTTLSSLRQTLYSGTYPVVERTRIWCPAGSHRVEAAKNLFGNDIHWIVQLHCPPDDLERGSYDEFIRTLAERHFVQCTHSDGEIFRNIRRYDFARPELVKQWRTRLSPSKQISLNVLLAASNTATKREKNATKSGDTVLQALDALLKFPGLWEGLELGNLHKHLALHCTEELVRYLRHVHDVWDYIAGGDPRLQTCVDIATARHLQSLAPCASLADRQLICSLLDENRIFSKVRDSLQRGQLKERILCLDAVIPSIKSFHEND